MDDLRYPIGRYRFDENSVNAEQRSSWIGAIEKAPAQLRSAVHGLSAEQLDTPYRPEGWTVRQLIHHVADSHINSYVRFRLAMTEDNPAIKPYEEKRWAELVDAKSAEPEVSLRLLESLHERWVGLLRSFKAEDYSRTFVHPENGPMSLDKALAIYAWHGAHHVAHIASLRQRMGWAGSAKL